VACYATPFGCWLTAADRPDNGPRLHGHIRWAQCVTGKEYGVDFSPTPNEAREYTTRSAWRKRFLSVSCDTEGAAI
jgi:hypothetical protein